MFAAHLEGDVTPQRQSHLHPPLDQQRQRGDILNTMEELRSPGTASHFLDAHVPVTQNQLVIYEGALSDVDVMPGPKGVGVHEVIQAGVKEALGAPRAVSDRYIVAVAVALQRVALRG